MSNAFNLIDGLDGLAAGVGFFATSTLFISAVINERWEIVLLCTALAGALLGFLRYNFNPASIFLGDCGSLFVGFALAGFAVRGSMKSSAAIAVAAPLIALALPLLDATIAMVRRALRGRSIFEADHDHIHHRMIRMGLTPRRVVIILYGVAALFGVMSLMTMSSRTQVVAVVIIAFSIVSWLGIQQLGYSEFLEIQRMVKGRMFDPRAVRNNIYLRHLTAEFQRARDLDALWATLVEAAARLQFLQVELLFSSEARGRLNGSLPEGFPVWARPEGCCTSAEIWTWAIPVMDGQVRLADLRIGRSVRVGQNFELSHLLGAIVDGFAPRLTEMFSQLPAADGPPWAGTTAARPVEPARTRPSPTTS
jgi:UDP-GlcNAc:undecaprenyl-phosphate GlcNAc-1-phosphate transferase